ncbi:hypothetical protein EX30DRAFT_340499, partial [Ascodesmis nigricans]
MSSPLSLPHLPVPAPTPATHSRRSSIPPASPWATSTCTSSSVPQPTVTGGGGNREGNGNGNGTGGGSYEETLRREMGLVAEAAKRASEEILARELEAL